MRNQAFRWGGGEMMKFAAEVVTGNENRVLRILGNLGAWDLLKIEAGYISWSGKPEWIEFVRQCRGVRTVMPVVGEEMDKMRKPSNESTMARVGDMVRVFRAGVAMVGRVTVIIAGKARIVTDLFGRPIEVEVPLSDAEIVELPEVWR